MPRTFLHALVIQPCKLWTNSWKQRNNQKPANAGKAGTLHNISAVCLANQLCRCASNSITTTSFTQCQFSLSLSHTYTTTRTRMHTLVQHQECSARSLSKKHFGIDQNIWSNCVRGQWIPPQYFTGFSKLPEGKPGADVCQSSVNYNRKCVRQYSTLLWKVGGEA